MRLHTRFLEGLQHKLNWGILRRRPSPLRDHESDEESRQNTRQNSERGSNIHLPDKANTEDDDVGAEIARLVRRIDISEATSTPTQEATKADQSQQKHHETVEIVRGNCNPFEEDLLGCLVDPAKLEVSLREVILDENTKATLQKLMLIYQRRVGSNPTRLENLVRINGALLYGPPGTGKTHLCRAIAKDLGLNMLSISAADIESKWHGESEKYIKASFTLATKLTPCALFIDEVDSLFYRRSSKDFAYRRSILNAFLHETDGISSGAKQPFILVATNRPADLDYAFLRRLPHKVPFTMPSMCQRTDILRTILKGQNVDSSLSLTKIAEMSPGYSGADLQILCGKAALTLAMEQVDDTESGQDQESSGTSLLEARHFISALDEVRPSVGREQIQEIQRFARAHNPRSRLALEEDDG